MKYALALLLAYAAMAQAPAANSSAILTVSGDLPMPLKLTLADLAAMPRQTVKIDSANGANAYEGVSLFEILKRAGAPNGGSLRGNALASYVLAKASDGYQVTFTVGEIDPSFGNTLVLVADHRDGAPLSGNQGSLRLVVPNDHEGARSVRMLETLEFIPLKK